MSSSGAAALSPPLLPPQQSPTGSKGAPAAQPAGNRPDADLLDLLGFGELQGDRRMTALPQQQVSLGPLGASPQPSSDDWVNRQIVLIRHGRSTWNEFLGQHKKREWAEEEQVRGTSTSSTKGLRSTLSKMVTGSSKGSPPPAAGGYSGSSFAGDAPDPLGADRQQSQSTRSGLMQAVRGGVKHVANALQNADKLQQVDHSLSMGGLVQARTLRRKIASVVQNDAGPLSQSGAASILLRCKQWYISPFLRALQTAAFGLAPLLRRDKDLQLLVTAEAGEVIKSSMALDCQGKVGNVGHRVVARAISRTAEAFEDEDDVDPENASAVAERQAELADVTTTLCAMDLKEVGRVWWKDVGSFKKEHLRLEDARVRRLVSMLLRQPGCAPVGVVAHSLLFQRILQLFWPSDASLQEALRNALRNGALALDTKDPLYDKIMNCGTLVLTWRYRPSMLNSEASDRTAEIVGAEFLFEGHMEGALAGEQQSLDVTDVAAEAAPIDTVDSFTASVGGFQGNLLG